MRANVLAVWAHIKRLGGFLGKYKAVAAIAVIIIIGLVAVQIHRHDSANMWKQATDAYRRADYQTAAKLLKNTSAPSDPDKLAIYAQTMLATRQLDKAADGYQKLYNSKKDPFAKLVLGNVYNQEKKYDEASKIYQELITSNPNYAQAYVNLATMDKVQGKNDQAVAVAKQAVKNNPGNTVLNELLVSMTMNDQQSDDYKTAVASLKKLNPQDPLLASINQ